MGPAIRTHGLTKRYGRKVAVRDLDLTVPAGTVFGLLGPNGAGKTTTLMMLLGNVHPSAGQAWLLGQPAGDLETRKRVGFLPERFQFHDFLTAAEVLRFHGRLAGMDRAVLEARLPATLALVGLADRAGSRVRTFSRGMQQRLGLAQAILHDPELVVLDEPASALDPVGRRDLRDLVARLKAEGKTVFLNSHLLSEIERTCDAVAILRQGQVVAQGPVPDLLAGAGQARLEVRGLPDSAWESLRRDFPGAAREGDFLTVPLPDEDATPRLAAAVVAAGGRLYSLAPARETLEDLFVRLVEG